MARKDLLKDLMNAPIADMGAQAPRVTKGAIGAVMECPH